MKLSFEAGANMSSGGGECARHFFLKILFVYLFIHERDIYIEGERQRHRQRKKQAPCREPDAGPDPRSPGSHPGLKAVLNH